MTPEEQNIRLREIIVVMKSAMAALGYVSSSDYQMTRCMFCGGVGRGSDAPKHDEQCAYLWSQKALTDPNLTIDRG